MKKTVSILLLFVLVIAAVLISYSVGAAGGAVVCERCQRTGDMDGNGKLDLDDAIHLLFHTNFHESYPLPGCEYVDGGDSDEPYAPPVDSESIQHSLDGKKFIFIGNSYTYYGKCVLSKSNTVLSQRERSNDKGYFYQIAKENGADIEVTNWTFGNHCLEDTFGGNCEANRECDGHDHTKDLTDRYFDYVMFQESSKRIDGFMDSVDTIMKLFREKNPNVKFFCLVPLRLYELDTAECKQVLKNLKVLEEKGVTIVDWGKIVYDVYSNNVEVPGSDWTYNRNSFVISQSSSDGHHQNMLVGYMTALMTWSAVTGDTAVGQEYRFTGDPSVNAAFDFDAYRKSYYSYGDVSTNFDLALQSKNEVMGFQKLIDKYLAEKGYRNYK